MLQYPFRICGSHNVNVASLFPHLREVLCQIVNIPSASAETLLLICQLYFRICGSGFANLTIKLPHLREGRFSDFKHSAKLKKFVFDHESVS